MGGGLGATPLYRFENMIKTKLFINNYFISIVIFSILNITFIGCYSFREAEIVSDGTTKIYKVELNDGGTVDFQNTRFGYGFVTGDKIVSITENGTTKEVLLTKVRKIYTEKFDYGKTIFLGIGLVGLAFLTLIVIIAKSMEGRGFGG